MNLHRSGAVCACFLLGLTTWAGAEKPAEKTKPAKKTEAKAKPKPEPAGLTLPAGAVQTGPATYTFTDAQGKRWIYRQTPFGLARVEDQAKPATPAEQASTEKQIAQTHAVENGDAIQFERPGPFGVYRWTKKKTDLNAVEKAVWDRDRGAQSSAARQE
jgi:hypothetical protein